MGTRKEQLRFCFSLALCLSLLLSLGGCGSNSKSSSNVNGTMPGSGSGSSGSNSGGSSGSGGSIGSPTGQFLFAAMGNAPSGTAQFRAIAEYGVNSNGTLTSVNPNFSAQNGADFVFHDPTDKFLYVLGPPNGSFNFNVVSAYSVGSNGSLMPVGGSPFNFNQQELASMEFRPDGKFVYMTDSFNATILHIISVDPSSGTLVQEVGTINVPSGANASILLRMKFDSSGHYLYLANAEMNTIAAYSSDPASGALTPVPGSPFMPRTASTGGCSPKGQNCGAALVADGSFLYYGSTFFAGIAAFQVNAATGALTEVGNSPFPDPGQNAFQEVTTPDGSLMYAINADGTLAGYMVNTSTGALTPVSGLPKPTAFGQLAIDNTGQFLYVGGALDAYTVNHSTGTLTQVPGSPYNPPGVTGITIVQ